MAKRYDGILLITDLDGTMIATDGTAPKVNCDAIARFQQNGGTFSVATGRMPGHFEKFSDCFVPNAPVITFNGAGIYDLKKKEMLWKKELPVRISQILQLAEPFKDEIDSVSINSEHWKEYERWGDYVSWQQVQDGLEEFDKEPWLKMIFCFRSVEGTLRVQKALQDSPLGELCDFCRSWSTGLEALHKDATKGCAVHQLRTMLPQIERVVCVGDYENDLSMVREADLGVAVSNAIDVVKQAADIVTVSNNEGAIAAIIDML